MKIKLIYLYELILALFIVALKFIFIGKLENYYKLAIILFSISSFFLLYKLLGIKKNNTILKRDIVNHTIISILAYFIVIYLSGLFLGFLKNGYSLKILDIFNNIFYLLIMIISQEYIRYMITSNKGTSKFILPILTVLYIILDFILVFNINMIDNRMNLFIFITTTLIPIIAEHLLYSFNAKHIDYKPNIIIRISLTIYPYIMPIIPNLGYYLESLIGLIYPYLIYLRYTSLIKLDEKIKKVSKKVLFINIPLIIILFIIIVLISGIFKYQIMAIGSGSMYPVYTRGDAVIFEKIDDSSSLNINDIIVYKYGEKYITHRLISVESKNGELYFQTKGDNNQYQDDFQVKATDVIGVVKCKIKYIGYPSIWFQDFIN